MQKKRSKTAGQVTLADNRDSLNMRDSISAGDQGETMIVVSHSPGAELAPVFLTLGQLGSRAGARLAPYAFKPTGKRQA